jgi:hypothetical protein
MFTSHAERHALRAAQDTAQLHEPLEVLEEGLSALGDALRMQDARAAEAAARELQAALVLAMDRFGRAARQGGVPEDLRRRLALATGQVAAQREALARATAALDRALEVLVPSPLPSAALYGSAGSAPRPAPLGRACA